jgi:CDP-diacylglycerol--glycerol-3-phosphate 3-phosphatidyltransferase
MKWYETITFPNMLTLARLFISPVTVPFLLVYLLPFNILWVNVMLTIIFLLFALTDFFDGYYARKFGQVTHLGSTLDPIADKFLLCTTLISLVAVHKIYFYWVVLLIAREFFVMGLRLVAAEKNARLPVIFWAKVKTCIEIFYIAVVIVNPSTMQSRLFNSWNMLEGALLIVTLGMSFFTAYIYYQQFIATIPLKEHMSYDGEYK